MMDAVKRRRAVGSLFDREACNHQRGSKHPSQVVVIVDNENDLSRRRRNHEQILPD
jgi:hypothetical protein